MSSLFLCLIAIFTAVGLGLGWYSRPEERFLTVTRAVQFVVLGVLCLGAWQVEDPGVRAGFVIFASICLGIILFAVVELLMRVSARWEAVVRGSERLAPVGMLIEQSLAAGPGFHQSTHQRMRWCGQRDKN